MTDNGLRRHWVIYYYYRKSLHSDAMHLEESSRIKVPRPHWSRAEMLAFALANAPSTTYYYQLVRTNEIGGRYGNVKLTELTPCR